MPLRYSWPLQKMIRWYDSGLSGTEIAEKLVTVRDHLGNTHTPTRGGVLRALRSAGIKLRVTASGRCGPKNPAWKGGRRITKDGYVEIRMPNHPRAHASGYVFEHILVAEKVLGRPLVPGECVHHDDDDKQNNAPTNLVVYQSHGDHLRETRKGRRPNWTEEGRRRMLAARRKRAARERAARRRREREEAKKPRKSTGIRLSDVTA